MHTFRDLTLKFKHVNPSVSEDLGTVILLVEKYGNVTDNIQPFKISDISVSLVSDGIGIHVLQKLAMAKG